MTKESGGEENRKKSQTARHRWSVFLAYPGGKW